MRTMTIRSSMIVKPPHFPNFLCFIKIKYTLAELQVQWASIRSLNMTPRRLVAIFIAKFITHYTYTSIRLPEHSLNTELEPTPFDGGIRLTFRESGISR